jgi:hypothetical protein
MGQRAMTGRIRLRDVQDKGDVKRKEKPPNGMQMEDLYSQADT